MVVDQTNNRVTPTYVEVGLSWMLGWVEVVLSQKRYVNFLTKSCSSLYVFDESWLGCIYRKRRQLNENMNYKYLISETRDSVIFLLKLLHPRMCCVCSD